MDAKLFRSTQTATSFCPRLSSYFSLVFSSNNSCKKLALAGLSPSSPSLSSANPSRSPSYLSACRICDSIPSSTLPPALHAAFGNEVRWKGEKIYTARDIALGLLDVFGWTVGVDGKGQVGTVADIVHIGTTSAEDSSFTPYEYILKVVRPFSSTEKTNEANLFASMDNSTSIRHRFTALEIKILIPIVDEFMQKIDYRRRHLQVKPPAGLLELAARPEAINRLQPEIQLFCTRYARFLQERFSGNKKIQGKGIADQQEIVYTYMPTRDQLFAVGRSDLVRRIKDAGGFLYVANALGLKTTRRPNGFWDDLQRLDFEIECFLLESWVKHVDSETGVTYFEDPVTNELTMEKPTYTEKPARTMSAGSVSVNDDVGNGLKVMPQQRLLGKAGRWDLHHAIVLNGGYREVAHLLGRRLIRRSKKKRILKISSILATLHQN